jgi:hypothetical protein
MSRALSFLDAMEEAVIIDHFETFELTQDFPFGVATPVGQRSGFVYGLDPCPHARTGSRSPAQEARLKTRPKRPGRGGYAGSFSRAMDILLKRRRNRERLSLVTDGHKDYLRAIGANRHRDLILHRGYPNPKRGPKGSPRSAEARARDRAMGPCDHLHRLFRHSLAHHRRETIAFGRRLNALMERLFLAIVWKNFVKVYREANPRSRPPAMRLGLIPARWNWMRVFARRMFPDRENVPPVWLELYRRDWWNPALPSNTRHRLAQAY